MYLQAFRDSNLELVVLALIQGLYIFLHLTYSLLLCNTATQNDDRIPEKLSPNPLGGRLCVIVRELPSLSRSSCSSSHRDSHFPHLSFSLSFLSVMYFLCNEQITFKVSVHVWIWDYVIRISLASMPKLHSSCTHSAFSPFGNILAVNSWVVACLYVRTCVFLVYVLSFKFSPVKSKVVILEREIESFGQKHIHTHNT